MSPFPCLHLEPALPGDFRHFALEMTNVPISAMHPLPVARRRKLPSADMAEAPRVLNARVDARDRVPTPSELRAAGAGAAFGDVSRCVRAGSLAVELRGLDARTASLVDEQYAGFVEDGGDRLAGLAMSPRAPRPSPEGGLGIRGLAAPMPPGPRHAALVDVQRSPAARWLHLSKGEGFIEDARVGARWDDGIELWSYGFAGRIESGAASGRLLLCEGGDLDVAQAIENYLRFFIAAQALAHGAFLLHSAGVARGGRAWLFFGPSGAGKSTTASHAPADADLLGDDLVLVEPEGGGSWRACGVPFRGSFARGRNAATCATIAMACRIVQADRNELSEVPRIVRVGEMLAQVPFLMDEPQARASAAEIVETFVRDVPVKRLHLTRDGSYWGLLG